MQEQERREVSAWREISHQSIVKIEMFTAETEGPSFAWVSVRDAGSPEGKSHGGVAFSRTVLRCAAVVNDSYAII